MHNEFENDIRKSHNNDSGTVIIVTSMPEWLHVLNLYRDISNRKIKTAHCSVDLHTYRTLSQAVLIQLNVRAISSGTIINIQSYVF